MQQIKPGERCFYLFQINWVARAESCVASLLPAAVASWWHSGGIACILGTPPLPSPSAEPPNNPLRHPGSPCSSLVGEQQIFGHLFRSIKNGYFFLLLLASEGEEVCYKAWPPQHILIITTFNAFRCGEAGSGIRGIFKGRAFHL